MLRIAGTLGCFARTQGSRRHRVDKGTVFGMEIGFGIVFGYPHPKTIPVVRLTQGDASNTSDHAAESRARVMPLARDL